jgi:glycosyltransferase involved in cell wall biosynthesis
MSNAKVCMFVWNHFTNDARVLRECTALSEAGYEVDLIAIHDPKDPACKKEEKRNGFSIKRVNRYPKLLLFFKRYYGALKRRKYILYPGILAVAAALFLYSIPLAVLMLGLAALLKVINFPRLWANGYVILGMIAEGKKKDYEIYHSNDLNTLPQGWICAKFLRLKKKKLVYDSHEVQTSRTGYGKNVYYIEKFFIKRIDSFINENKTRAEYTAKLYSIEVPKVIHNYPFYKEVKQIQKVDLHEMLGIDKEEPILLYQGGIQTGRGLDKLIEAVPMFKRGILVLLGDGRIKSDLLRRVEEKGLQDKVRFVPKVPVEELPNYTVNAYLGFQVLNNVCFNHYSASSNKLFEYIMAEVPVIACSFPEIQRAVEEGKVGICVDSHDPKSIAEGVNRLLDNRQLRDEMSKNCINARLKYNWENEKKLFLNIYEGLLS